MMLTLSSVAMGTAAVSFGGLYCISHLKADIQTDIHTDERYKLKYNMFWCYGVTSEQ